MCSYTFVVSDSYIPHKQHVFSIFLNHNINTACLKATGLWRFWTYDTFFVKLCCLSPTVSCVDLVRQPLTKWKTKAGKRLRRPRNQQLSSNLIASTYPHIDRHDSWRGAVCREIGVITYWTLQHFKPTAPLMRRSWGGKIEDKAWQNSTCECIRYVYLMDIAIVNNI